MLVKLWVVACVVLLSACGQGDFERADAIVALQTTGVTEAEATCIADSLVSLQALDAADPRQPRTDERRSAFVNATSRCVSTEVLGNTVERSVSVVPDIEASKGNTPVVEVEDSNAGGSALSQASEADKELAQDAVATLVRQGRSTENAQCIVDQLVAVNGEMVFLDQNFGLGLDPLEANAIASCL